MSVNGREIEALLKSAQEQLELYKTANIGELLETTLSSVEESTKTIELAFARLERIRQQLAQRQQQQQQEIAELGEVERQFSTRREQEYRRDAQELQGLIDSPARTQLLNTREQIARLNAELARMQGMRLGDALDQQDRTNILKVQVYQSLGLDLDKVRGLAKEEVWSVIETLWG